MKAGFKVKEVAVTNGGFTYRTFKLTGWRREGSRVRLQFQSRDEAEGEKNRLEVEAANATQEVRTVATHLSPDQVRVAEALFKLTPDPLFAVRWFADNYRPLRHEMALGAPEVEGTAAALFLAERAKHVRACVLGDYKRTMADFCAAFPARKVHEIQTEDVQQFLDGRGVGKKRFNNMRGELCTFFGYCMTAPRRWMRENPVTPIPAFEITKGLPEILSAEKAAELMAFVESYHGGDDRDVQRGCLAPYFALALFAGIRPDPMKGELKKLADRDDLARLINMANAQNYNNETPANFAAYLESLNGVFSAKDVAEFDKFSVDYERLSRELSEFTVDKAREHISGLRRKVKDDPSEENVNALKACSPDEVTSRYESVSAGLHEARANLIKRAAPTIARLVETAVSVVDREIEEHENGCREKCAKYGSSYDPSRDVLRLSLLRWREHTARLTSTHPKQVTRFIGKPKAKAGLFGR